MLNTKAEKNRVINTIAPLYNKPAGVMIRQLLHGEGFTVEKRRNGWAKGYRMRDHYQGFIKEKHLAPWVVNNARIKALGGHIYPKPDIKTTPIKFLPYQSQINIVSQQGNFAKLHPQGFIHRQHIEPLERRERDYVQTALNYLDVPYLWGGNSQFGIDCSGLISAALSATAIPCPADSIEQAKIGISLSINDHLKRADIIAWREHIGMMRDQNTLIHANAFHMRVACEPLQTCCSRIAAHGGGAIVTRRRLINH